MGAGKSSLVEWLRQQFGMTPFFEPNEANPYLADFYGDMRRWAFHSQLWFLIRRFEIHRAIDASAGDPHPVVQDRTIYEDAEIFAAHLHQLGYVEARDWASYQELYTTLRSVLRPPDLMIYLRCPLKTLVKRIKQRGRDYEQRVPRKYLASLENLYEGWVESYDASPKLVVETDRLDYVEHLFDRLELLEAVEYHAGIAPLSKRTP
jgi:deoxyadenosine/deoxycytidine kinase